MKNVHPCTFFIDEICDERKSRFYMEPAASVPLLPVRLSSYGLLSSVRPCQVQKLTFMSIFEREFLLGKNVATADRMSVVLHSIEFFIRKTRSSQMYKDVHL